MAKSSYSAPGALEQCRSYWGEGTYASHWDANARNYPDQEALVDSQQRLTWAQAKQLTDRIALNLLKLGIRRDAVVVLQLPNSVELYVWRIACEKAGLLSISVLRSFRQYEMEYILSRLEAVAIVIPDQFGGRDYYAEIQAARFKLPSLKHVFLMGSMQRPSAISTAQLLVGPAEADALSPKAFTNQDIMLFCTSGSTGFPKFVEMPMGVRIFSSKLRAQLYAISNLDVLAGLALSAVGANAVPFITGSLFGAKSVLLENFTPEEALDLLQQEKVTILASVPTILLKLVNHPNFSKYDLSALRLVNSGGGPLPYSQAVELQKRFPCPVVQGYGATELGLGCFNRPDDPVEVRLGTVGRPLGGQIKLVSDAGKEVAVGEVGEILGKDPGEAAGYYNDAEATSKSWDEEHWYHTGDLGRFDVHGNLTIVGRKKDMIIRGGQNIYPIEVESFLAAHPKVAEVAVIGVPDKILGEKACAVVVTRLGQRFTFEEMLAFLRGKNLASFKLPEYLELRDSLPHLQDSQKIDKRVLQRDIGERMGF